MSVRVGFVTGHRFGCHALTGILAAECFLNGALTVPLVFGLDPKHAGRTVGFASPAELAGEAGAVFRSVTDGTLASQQDEIRAAGLDYLLVIGWSRLISPDVLALPSGDGGRHRCIGMHPSPLPIGRGQAPIPWTIIKGLDRSALSVFELTPSADQGAILAQYSIAVQPSETAASLFRRFERLHFDAGFELAGNLGRREIRSSVQDEHSSTVWPKRRPSDGALLTTMTTAEVDRLVRGLLGPYPRAFVSDGTGGRFEVDRVSSEPVPDGRPFDCADGRLWLTGRPVEDLQ